MKILILGVAHGVQTASGACSDDQKAKYRELVGQHAAGRSIGFIAEEIAPCHFTIAGDLAISLGIPWEPIDMSKEEKRRAGVPERGGTTPLFLGKHACTRLTDQGYQRDLGNGWVEVEYRDESDKERDEFMFAKVLLLAGEAQSALVICGYNHVLQLSRKFAEAGHDVASDALYKYDWFGA
jgi:hypothetical protein